jgi:hypothetical protein
MVKADRLKPLLEPHGAVQLPNQHQAVLVPMRAHLKTANCQWSPQTVLAKEWMKPEER